MEVGLLPREHIETGDGAPKTDQAGQEQSVSPRVREAALCIEAVMREQGLTLEIMDPYGNFNPEVRKLLSDNRGEL